jgi:hypothetical protein
MNRTPAAAPTALFASLLVACGGPFGDGVFSALPEPGEPGGAMAAGGAGGAFEPPPEPPPGPPCLLARDCAADAYCHRPFGLCFGPGSCQPRPETCDAVVESPVCTCFGGTAASPCAAAQAGQNIAYPGACGASCDERADCPEGLFCRALRDVALANENRGTCGPLPPDCGRWNPVCSAYPAGEIASECDAARQDAWLDGPGACDACVNADACQRGNEALGFRDVCLRPRGDCGQPTVGVCHTIDDHDMCAWQLGFGDPAPVCTCDGQTLRLACQADWEGLQIDHDGPCENGP